MVFDAFKRFKAYAENQLDCKIKALRDDKGGEYMSREFLKFTDECGIARQHTVRNRPQQNGVAE
jgi:transposase InsO family protein